MVTTLAPEHFSAILTLAIYCGKQITLVELIVLHSFQILILGQVIPDSLIAEKPSDFKLYL